MANTLRKPEGVDAGAEALLQETLSECGRATERLKDLLRLADALIPVLPPERRVGYLEAVERFRSVARAARGDQINDNIIAFVKEKKEVTASEVKEALITQGVPVDTKRVNNSLDYLVRREQLQRIGRGEYRINPAVEAEIEEMLTANYGPPTYRGHPPGGGDQDY